MSKVDGMLVCNEKNRILVYYTWVDRYQGYKCRVLIPPNGMCCAILSVTSELSMPLGKKKGVLLTGTLSR